MILGTVFRKIFGSRNDRLITKLNKIVSKINELESSMQALSDEQLKAKTQEFRDRLSQGETLDQLLPEAFATVREVSVRTMGMRHFDVQLVGGMVLHHGKIAEMRTGEGKTLMATLTAYLNALSGKGVHVVTVNDYLAQRDAKWNSPIYEFLGLTVGVIVSDLPPEQRKAAYQADITYGTNNEFGFDYLRDNMAFSLEEKVQRGLNFAVIDEVDSILIDEARTPLIISGAVDGGPELYVKANKLIPHLVQRKEEHGTGDFYLDEKTKQAYLTEQGHNTVESLLIKEGMLKEGDSLYAIHNIHLMHYLSAALRAHKLFAVDVDYIVQNGEVVIVDEHTGRTMPGRRWSDGLHQAIEAKENVSIQQENQTLASITFQNYFRLYEKLSGMTGTADTEAYELHQIYGLEVAVIPTNKPMIREDHGDQIYLTAAEKFEAIIADIKASREKQQPVLVGTASIETSEYLSGLLKRAGIPHSVLNAKQHAKEAQIIAQAGRPGTITLATNMAGRGTDIVLGGNFEAERAELGDVSEDKIAEAKKQWQARHQQVLDAGGLYVLGTERHESRRIDNQLRGRSGRQGDPGKSRFYLSLQDDLMRIFASDRMAGIMQKLGMQEGEAIEHPWVSKAIESAQRKVEGHNFDMRKQLLEFDDVANEQRKVIYSQRAGLMEKEDMAASINGMVEDVIQNTVSNYVPPQSFSDLWDIAGLEQVLRSDFNQQLPIQQWLDEDDQLHEESLRSRLLKDVMIAYREKVSPIDSQTLNDIQRSVVLQVVDNQWREHLAAMDHLRQGIHLRGYAQKNPTQEYKRESFIMFSNLLDAIKHEVVSLLLQMRVGEDTSAEAAEEQRREQQASVLQFKHADPDTEDEASKALQQNNTAGTQPSSTFVRQYPKVGRNDPCPCGSGKKYKHCHGRVSVTS